jgi:hypothetical protein
MGRWLYGIVHALELEQGLGWGRDSLARTWGSFLKPHVEITKSRFRVAVVGALRQSRFCLTRVIAMGRRLEHDLTRLSDRS